MDIQVNGELLFKAYERNKLEWGKRYGRLVRLEMIASISWFLGVLFMYSRALVWFVKANLESPSFPVTVAIMVATVAFGILCVFGLVAISEFVQRPRTRVYSKHTNLETRIAECQQMISEGKKEAAQSLYDKSIAPHL